MLKIGCHLSSAKGFLAMGQEIVRLGGNTFQFFTRNPRGSKAKALDQEGIAAYLAFAEAHGLFPALAHAPYTLNACAARPEVLEFARETMADDLARLEYLPGSMYNFHPGSHVGQGTDTGVRRIAALLNAILREEQHTTVLLETMAGKGSEVGGRFEELRAILEQVELKHRVGVCLDTCHVYDGGYDIVDGLEAVLEEFDRVIGLNRLRAVHLNDSMNPMGSHKDRHQKLGEGAIGMEAVGRIVNHPALRELPFYLETPNDLPGYAREIAAVQAVYREEEG